MKGQLLKILGNVSIIHHYDNYIHNCELALVENPCNIAKAIRNQLTMISDKVQFQLFAI